MNPLLNAICWLTTLASAADERAEAMPNNLTVEDLRALLKTDAEQARKIANELQTLIHQ